MSDMWGMPRESRESDLQEAVQGADKPVAWTLELLALSRSAQARVLLCLLVPTEGIGVCCFVSLRMSYRVPRVSPGVAAPILRSPPSRATPGLPSSFADRVPK